MRQAWLKRVDSVTGSRAGLGVRKLVNECHHSTCSCRCPCVYAEGQWREIATASSFAPVGGLPMIPDSLGYTQNLNLKWVNKFPLPYALGVFQSLLLCCFHGLFFCAVSLRVETQLPNAIWAFRRKPSPLILKIPAFKHCRL